MIPRLLFLFLLVVAFPVSAGLIDGSTFYRYVDPRIKITSPRSVDSPYARISDVYNDLSSSGGVVKASGTIGGKIGGKSLSTVVSKVLSPATIATALKNPVRLLGPVALGMTLTGLIWDAAQEQWMKPGGPIEDIITYPAGKYKIADGYGPSPVAACQAYCSLHGYTYKFISFNLGPPINFRCYYYNNTTYIPGGSMVYSCPAGTVYDMDDNVCRQPQTGAPTVPTDAEMETAIETACQGDAAACINGIRAAGGLAPHPDLLDGPEPVETSGPDALEGPTTTTTTTTPEGTTTVTKATNYTIIYSNQNPVSEVAITATTTITTCTGPNSCTTIIITNPPDGEDTQDGEIAIDTEFPDTPNDVPMETQDLNMDYSPTMTDSGSCPGPITLDFLGTSNVIEYTLLCNFARGLRPFLIIVASIGAGLMIFASARRMS